MSKSLVLILTDPIEVGRHGEFLTGSNTAKNLAVRCFLVVMERSHQRSILAGWL